MTKLLSALIAAIFAVVSLTPVALAADKMDEKKEATKKDEKKDKKKKDEKKEEMKK